MAEDASARSATRQHADEFDGVDVDALTVQPLAVLPAGRPFEGELEELTVDRRPLGDDVGDEATVMIRGEIHRAARRRADVDSVGPHVAREADVEEVLEG